MTQVVRVLASRCAPTGVVASIPHSGTYVPAEIAADFTDEHRGWLRNTDWFLDELYDFLADLGVVAVVATHSRYVADVNRDPRGPAHGPFFKSVVAAATADGRPIYKRPPSIAALTERIQRYHQPYHAAIDHELDLAARRCGRALLIDLHSYMSPGEADVCIGNGRRTTATAHSTRIFEDAFGSSGFSVATNEPWSGGYVVRQHADLPRIEALQLELRYTTYLDEATIDTPGEPKRDPAKWADTQSRLRRSLADAIAAWQMPTQVD